VLKLLQSVACPMVGLLKRRLRRTMLEVDRRRLLSVPLKYALLQLAEMWRRGAAYIVSRG
jgi:hypothetical protein